MSLRQPDGRERTLALVLATVCLTAFGAFALGKGFGDFLCPLIWVAGVVVAAIVILALRCRMLLLSPLLWMATILFVGFLVLPPLFIAVEAADPLYLEAVPILLEEAAAYVGSLAESMMLATVFAVAGAFALVAAFPVTGGGSVIPRRTPSPVVLTAAGLVAAAAYAFATAWIPPDVTLPMMGLILGLLSLSNASRVPKAMWGLALVIVAVLGATISRGEMKISVAVLSIPVMAFWVLRGLKLQTIALISIMAIAAIIVPMVVLPALSHQTFAQHLRFISRTKILLRQSDTAHCLHVVTERHWRQGRSGHMDVLFSALVPRRLWPEKPQVSDGAMYGHEYCNRGFSEGSPHSASLTVIGEPILEAGRSGWAWGLAALLAIGTVSTVASRRGGMGMVAVLALFPWLIDVDQNFAMYIARLGKAALVMGALSLPFLILRRPCK